jgi:hypothetical protein
MSEGIRNVLQGILSFTLDTWRKSQVLFVDCLEGPRAILSFVVNMNTRITNWPASFSVFNRKRGREGIICTKEIRSHGSVEKGAQSFTLHQILLGQSQEDGMGRDEKCINNI